MRQLVSDVFNSLSDKEGLDADEALEVLEYSVATLSVFRDFGDRPVLPSSVEEHITEGITEIVGDWVIDCQSHCVRPSFSQEVVPYDILATCVPNKWNAGDKGESV